MFHYKNPVFIDLETDTPTPTNAQIIQIAAFNPLSNDKFQVKLRFEYNSLTTSPKALDMNNYNEEVWEKEAINRKEGLQQFTEFLSKHASIDKVSKRGNNYSVASIVGYNILKFDMPILEQWCTIEDIFLPIEFRVLDVMQLALWDCTELESYKLQDLAKAFDLKSEKAHDALSDVILTADIAALILTTGDKDLDLEWVQKRIRRMNRRKE